MKSSNGMLKGSRPVKEGHKKTPLKSRHKNSESIADSLKNLIAFKGSRIQ